MDYEQLLKKYMKLVIECEGFDFLVHASEEATGQTDVAFTRAEIKRLERISKEVCE